MLDVPQRATGEPASFGASVIGEFGRFGASVIGASGSPGALPICAFASLGGIPVRPTHPARRLQLRSKRRAFPPPTRPKKISGHAASRAATSERGDTSHDTQTPITFGELENEQEPRLTIRQALLLLFIFKLRKRRP